MFWLMGDDADAPFAQGATEWDHTLLKTLTPYVDYHSIHW